MYVRVKQVVMIHLNDLFKIRKLNITIFTAQIVICLNLNNFLVFIRIESKKIRKFLRKFFLIDFK
jgi:hypothetical protein